MPAVAPMLTEPRRLPHGWGEAAGIAKASRVTSEDGGEWISTGLSPIELRVRGPIYPVKNGGESQTPTITRLPSQPKKL